MGNNGKNTNWSIMIGIIGIVVSFGTGCAAVFEWLSVPENWGKIIVILCFCTAGALTAWLIVSAVRNTSEKKNKARNERIIALIDAKIKENNEELYKILNDMIDNINDRNMRNSERTIQNSVEISLLKILEKRIDAIENGLMSEK